MKCLSLTDPTNRYFRRLGARGCNGKKSFGRWKYDRDTEWTNIPCPACVPIQRRPNKLTVAPTATAHSTAYTPDES